MPRTSRHAGAVGASQAEESASPGSPHAALSAVASEAIAMGERTRCERSRTRPTASATSRTRRRTGGASSRFSTARRDSATATGSKLPLPECVRTPVSQSGSVEQGNSLGASSSSDLPAISIHSSCTSCNRCRRPASTSARGACRTPTSTGRRDELSLARKACALCANASSTLRTVLVTVEDAPTEAGACTGRVKHAAHENEPHD